MAAVGCPVTGDGRDISCGSGVRRSKYCTLRLRNESSSSHLGFHSSLHGRHHLAHLADAFPPCGVEAMQLHEVDR